MTSKKRVLITGGAGSLGRAFVGLLHEKNELIVVDNNEWALAQLSHSFPDVKCVLADFSSWQFANEPAEAIVHLAAYKHVPMGEDNPIAFIENNLTKSMSLFAEASRYNVDLLFVSTDKAVEPVSTYGFTKALAERVAKFYGFSVGRLGNVLASQGSVIPVWEEAIQKKEPIKITDERMSRYVIEDYDAANQLWHEFIGGKRLIVPKMGPPIRLLDILTEVLKRHGYKKASDYWPGVQIIGRRPGEKLAEKLLWEGEE